jgi:hypothetical protein
MTLGGPAGQVDRAFVHNPDDSEQSPRPRSSHRPGVGELVSYKFLLRPLQVRSRILAWATFRPRVDEHKSGDRYRATVASGGALNGSRRKAVDELVLLIGNQFVEDEVLVIEDAVFGL